MSGSLSTTVRQMSGGDGHRGGVVQTLMHKGGADEVMSEKRSISHRAALCGYGAENVARNGYLLRVTGHHTLE